MTNPVTPNIGLNKIDRTSPSTTYFDLEKYIDQNADAVDQFAGETKQSLDSLASRLDTEERREVVLQPGLQVVHAERTAPFSLSGIKGRTLVNLLGRDGDFESSISTTQSSSAIAMLDNTSFYTGSNSLKVTASGTGRVEHYVDIRGGYKVNQGRYYILMGMVRVNKGAAQMKVYSHLSQTDPNFFMSNSNIVSDKRDYFSLVRTAFSPVVDCDVIPRLYLLKDEGTPLYEQDGESSNFDSVRIFEVSQEEYDSFILLTDEEISIKYPYVNSTQSVSNPYVIRYGENLLPPFYEWTNANGGGFTINSPYDATLVRNASGQSLRVEVPVIPGQIYTLSLASPNPAYVSLHFYDSSGSLVSSPVNGLENTPVSATAPNNSAYVRVVLGGDIGTYNFKKPMLTLGSDPKPFKPREDSFLAFQTELHANPVSGSDPDVLFERDGQYFKLAKWKKQALDGSLDWRLNPQPRSGYKEVYVPGLVAEAIKGGGFASKFDGKILTALNVGAATTEGDQFLINSDNAFVLAISNTDSGWGDDYTPTQDEIKAYFMGYKMYPAGGNGSAIFAGSGTKAWVYRTPSGLDGWQNVGTTIPTIPAPTNAYWQPYQLVHQLATPTVEPIVFEGMLTFNEGDNQIEVGTGIVLRESVKPAFNGVSNWFINRNDSGFTSSLLKKRVDRILVVFRDSRVDNNWKSTSTATPYGKELRYVENANYDPSAAYSVTYLNLDKSPSQPISGSLAASEKAQISNLMAGVAEALQRVSVVEQKKAEADSPGWIAPTLLNGWVRESTTFGYVKDPAGNVRFRGRISSGATASGTLLFTLPVGVRPTVYGYYQVTVNTGASLTTGFIMINIDGTVVISYFPGNTWINWDTVSFLAEQ